MELKKTGVVRRIDDLGRIVIPKEFRRQMRIQEGDPLELCVCDCEGQFGVLFVPYRALECNFPKRRVLNALYDGIPNKDVVVALVDLTLNRSKVVRAVLVVLLVCEVTFVVN